MHLQQTFIYKYFPRIILSFLLLTIFSTNLIGQDNDRKEFINPSSPNRDGHCDTDYTMDCDGNCFADAIFEEYEGDGICDGVDAPFGINLFCDEYNFDGTDCDDCLNIPGGDAVDLGCGCNEPGPQYYWYDQDGDGLGAGPAHEYCEGQEPAGWVITNNDAWPECQDDGTNPFDAFNICNGDGTIQSAIDAAEPSSTIDVPSGTYNDGINH